MKKFLSVILLTLTVSVFPISCVFIRKGHTPAITPLLGKQSIAQLEFINLGGWDQAVLTRSANSDAPVLLFLHGGPGMPLMYLAHKFQRPVEKNFTIVHWDQRGAGKSYSDKIPVETINVEQYLSDALQLIDTLQQRHGKQKIYLVAHSWGTYLGSILASRHPELFECYISIGQVVDHEKALPLQQKFLYAQAVKRGDKKAITQLDQYGNRVFETYLFKYGAELKYSKNFFPLLWAGLNAREYSFSDALNVSKGSSFCNNNMNYNAIDGTILEVIKAYELPVYFMVGTNDYTTPWELIQEYYDLIEAPYKKIIWFKDSAHFPFLEEPAKFNEELLDIIKQNNTVNSLNPEIKMRSNP